MSLSLKPRWGGAERDNPLSTIHCLQETINHLLSALGYSRLLSTAKSVCPGTIPPIVASEMTIGTVPMLKGNEAKANEGVTKKRHLTSPNYLIGKLSLSLLLFLSLLISSMFPIVCFRGHFFCFALACNVNPWS